MSAAHDGWTYVLGELVRAIKWNFTAVGWIVTEQDILASVGQCISMGPKIFAANRGERDEWQQKYECRSKLSSGTCCLNCPEVSSSVWWLSNEAWLSRKASIPKLRVYFFCRAKKKKKLQKNGKTNAWNLTKSWIFRLRMEELKMVCGQYLKSCKRRSTAKRKVD